jgi:hypothetical protein
VEKQYIASGLNGRAVDVRPDQECSLFDSLLPPSRFGIVQPGLLERTADITRCVPGRFSERGGERTISNDRSDSRNDNADHSYQVCGQLPQSRRGAGIFDLRAR